MPPRGRRSEVGGGGGALGALVGWGAVLGRVLDTEAAQARVAQAGNRDEPPATRARVSYRGKVGPRNNDVVISVKLHFSLISCVLYGIPPPRLTPLCPDCSVVSQLSNSSAPRPRPPRHSKRSVAWPFCGGAITSAWRKVKYGAPIRLYAEVHTNTHAGHAMALHRLSSLKPYMHASHKVLIQT